jgi:hypothetical protein
MFQNDIMKELESFSVEKWLIEKEIVISKIMKDYFMMDIVLFLNAN